jgi:hypothetical protein
VKIEGIEPQDEICSSHRRHVEATLGLEHLKFGNRSQRLVDVALNISEPLT